MTRTPFYRKSLQDAFERRLERNPRYSLRAFSQSLGVDSGVCSQLLSGKRVPSLGVAERLMDRLNLDALEREAFLRSIGEEKLKNGLRRVSPELRKRAQAASEVTEPTRRDLSIDAFQAVSRWYYYAILELVKLPDFVDSPKWIARELGIPEAEAKIAYARLFELQMLERAPSISGNESKVRKTSGSFYTADPHLTSSAHRRRQKEILEKSIDALENDPIELRNHSAMTVAIDPALIPEAKKRISAFLQELSNFLESGTPSRVYEIQLGLFSLQTSVQTPIQTPIRTLAEKTDRKPNRK